MEKHRNEGYNDYLMGLDRIDNPYPENTKEGKAWDFGWSEAYGDAYFSTEYNFNGE